MWAERERQNFCSPLKPISVTPDARSVPRSATSRSRSSQFFHTRSPFRSRSPDFWPASLQLRSCSNMFQAANWKGGPIFTREQLCYSAVLAVVILYVCLSVCRSVCLPHACFVLWQSQTMHCGYFDTTRKGNHPSFLTLKGIGGRRPLRLKFALKVTQPFKTHRLRQICAYHLNCKRKRKQLNYGE